MLLPTLSHGQRVSCLPSALSQLLAKQPELLRGIMARSSPPLEFHHGTVISRLLSDGEWRYVILPDCPLLWPIPPSPLADYLPDAPADQPQLAGDAVSRVAAAAILPLRPLEEPPEEGAVGLPVLSSSFLAPLASPAPAKDPHRRPAGIYSAREYALFCRRPTREEVEQDPLVPAMVPACFPVPLYAFDPAAFTIRLATLHGHQLWQLIGPDPSSPLEMGLASTLPTRLLAFNEHWADSPTTPSLTPPAFATTTPEAAAMWDLLSSHGLVNELLASLTPASPASPSSSSLDGLGQLILPPVGILPRS